MPIYEKVNEKPVVNIEDLSTFVVVQDGKVYRVAASDVLGYVNEKTRRYVDVTLPASGWSADAPYSQRVAVPGVLSTDRPILYKNTPKNLSADETKTRDKMTPYITDIESENGFVTFYCKLKKPTANLVVTLGGVSANG